MKSQIKVCILSTLCLSLNITNLHINKRQMYTAETIRLYLEPYAPAIWKALLMYAITILAVMTDLWSGIRKARKAGIYTHSYGLRQTVAKLARYFNILIMCSLIDAIVIVIELPVIANLPLIPYTTCLFTLILCGIELFSVFEKDENKGKYVEAAKVAKEALKGVDLDELAEVLLKKMEKKKDGEG